MKRKNGWSIVPLSHTLNAMKGDEKKRQIPPIHTAESTHKPNFCLTRRRRATHEEEPCDGRHPGQGRNRQGSLRAVPHIRRTGRRAEALGASLLRPMAAAWRGRPDPSPRVEMYSRCLYQSVLDPGFLNRLENRNVLSKYA